MNPGATQLRYLLQGQPQGQPQIRAFSREHTTVEYMADPGLLTLGEGSLSFLLPGYNLKPVTALEFSHFVTTLHMCNPSLHLNYATILALWSTLVLQVYHFQGDDVKSAKLSEVGFGSETAHDAGVEDKQRLEILVLKHTVATLRGQLRRSCISSSRP